jgi:transposase
MWTADARRRHDRRAPRYPSDLTDAEWALLEPGVPPARPGGRPRSADMREVVNALLYMLNTGCQWRFLPTEFPPRSTVHGYFRRWQKDGEWPRLRHALVGLLREKLGREASPSAAILDSQSVRAGAKGGVASIRSASPPASRSRAASATSWSTPRA